MKKRPDLEYTYRGLIERGKDYHWVEGYSKTGPNGGIEYPWSTMRECQQEAKKLGYKAIFKRK